MLRRAKENIEEKLSYLNELDTATGDGDHGTAILSAISAAVAASEQEGTLSQTLTAIAWGVMGATGGSTSSLLGSFFLGMGDAVDGDLIGAGDVCKMFANGLEQVQTMTTAKIGDKTLMDALIPAVRAAKEYCQKTKKPLIADLFAAVAAAAQQGAESTTDYVARFGRAKNLGERSKGHKDAGATSMALIFQSFADVAKG